ncbi:unnamed protein product, partial [Choristocarpus tenellus]
LPLRLQEAVDRLCEAPDLRDRSALLVQLGDVFSRSDRGIDLPAPGAISVAHRVPGCVAEVYVTVDVEPAADKEGGEVVNVRGAADARLSRGILALLANTLSGESPTTVLGIDGKILANAVGLRAGLTESRINGLGNLLHVIQEQVRRKMTSRTKFGDSGVSHNAKVAQLLVDGENAIQGDENRSWGAQPNPTDDKEVAVLLSGGVDSSVALRLLLDQGYRPRAFYLKIWLEDELAHLGECPWEEDLMYATAVCEQVGVPLEVVPLQKEYWDHVVAYTVKEAREGRTPNPDVMCNSRIKFGMFYNLIGKHFSRVATGHYARMVLGAGVHGEGGGVGQARLLCSPDEVKDQTYFLCALTQEQLRKAMFPIGAYTKAQIRDLAEGYNLPTKARKDSQARELTQMCR